MEPAPLVLLLLGLLRGGSGQPKDQLVVTPRQPVVQFGGSVQLNCSLACAGGTVEWKGLDTNLGSVTSFPTHSILHISSAVVAMGGTKICQGTCHGQRYQRTVDLKVYALPDRLQLEAEPGAPGQPTSLRCSARGVYPLVGLRLTWYQGHRALEEADFHVTETEEELFDIVSMLLVAREEVGNGAEFRCEVTLTIRQETFTRVACVTMSTGDVMEQPVATATSSGSPRTAVATMGTPSTARPVTSTALPPESRPPTSDPTTVLTTTLMEPGAETLLELAATAEPPSTARPDPRDLVTGSPTARVATATLPGTGPPMGTVPTCSLRIWSLPPNGTRGRALRIECHARCSGNGTGTVSWLRTPVALSQYREEAAGSSSTLRLDRAEPRHQGRYQCVLLGHRSPAATLQLAVSDDPSSAGPAITAGTTVSLLGLIMTGIVSHRLWKRFRAQYELS
ncbi:mucosal addressin cell adhesion molecule 1 [Apus apus]|uniref:mucosal addressin cell adhesion molecule 1 n=1 Tax=Apus apus TaxID=8895 RepID=UPI0021F91B6A|nr:mucosal addressin cell adhesion molecule 1 [Apus apus]